MMVVGVGLVFLLVLFCVIVVKAGDWVVAKQLRRLERERLLCYGGKCRFNCPDCR